MAETILLGFAKIVLSQLGSLAIEELKLNLGVEKEVNSIKSNFSSIQAVLRDAERKQSKSEAVKNWLGKLQDVMYDIDNLLDDITTEVKLQDKNKGEWGKQVRKFFSRTNTLVLRSQWAHRIKSLCALLDQIAVEKNNYVLFTELEDTSRSDWRETQASVDKSELILGREDDKEKLMNLILNPEDGHTTLSVVPIVGIGGMGKTKLAQLIYNDSRIDANFDRKLWVYVSEKFNMKKILLLVLSMVTGENMEQVPLEQLRIKISEAFKYKKYFLILDDMWNDDSSEWRKLRGLLDVGATGSTVVVTTRDTKVASTVNSGCEYYRLSELSRETSLQIFKKLAFKDGERIESTLLSLSEKIVEKSRGLPLLVTTLGNLLHGNKDEREWNFVIQKLEKGHEDILNILKLSYDQLNSNTKLCFRVSSVYGKGFDVVPLLQLLPLWTALGFLPPDNEGEALGRKCVEELSSKSLYTKQDDDAPDDVFNSFRMHDFVYDLAKFMAGDELAVIDSSSKDIPDQIRYMKLDEDEMVGKLCHQELVVKAKKARLLLINNTEESLSKDLLESIISSFKFLRVLDLHGCQFMKLPRTIGYMKHLRYLNLARNLSIKQLPDSVCNLINLQSLILTYCDNLQELPADIGRLENLRYLMVTMQQEFLPESIGLLKALRILFLCNCAKLAFLPSSTKQLQNLDTLLVFGCVELDLGHGSWSLEGLNSLRVLGIHDLPKFRELPINAKGLLPFTSLQHLFIVKCLGLTELTDWINCLSSLKTLKIGNCHNLQGWPYTRSRFVDLANLLDIEINGETIE